MRRPVFALLPFLALAACDHARGEGARAPAAAGTRVDSVLPRAEEMRRFTAGLGEPPRGLAGGEASLEALARRHLRAAARGDTAELRRMHLTRAEFAWLYYPHAPLSRPPYDLSPGLMWLQVERGTGYGAGTVLAALRGADAAFLGVRCAAPPEPQGPNLLHAGCAVRYVLAGEGEREEVLFGPVLERGGRFKFVSYAVPE